MKLVWKTFIAFALVLLVLAVSIGILFGQLFRKNTLDTFKQQLGDRARQLAEAVADIPTPRPDTNRPESSGRGMQLGRNQRGVTDYLNFLAGHSSEDIWLIDRDYNILMSPDSPYAAWPEQNRTAGSGFPEHARGIVEAAFGGSSTYTEQFSDSLGQTTLTVGQPVIANGAISGVLLLHAPVAGLQEANKQANDILLVSLGSGVLVAAIVAYLFSRRLSKPLVNMQKNAALMAAGDYSARCHLTGSDEVAVLGHSLDTLAVRLADARDEAARMQASRQDFLAAVSHELRTPVTVLRGLLEAWQDGISMDPEDMRRQMQKETAQLERLITDLLELSRLQQDDFRLSKESLSLNQVLEDAVRAISPLARARDITLNLSKHEREIPLEGDYGRLKQLFMTVLDNAVRVSPQGGHIDITYRGRTVTVRDYGSGIPAEDLPHIFERYFQGTGSKGSSGLGLAIAAAIAARHDIGIDVQSRPGDTKFTFSLPAR